MNHVSLCAAAALVIAAPAFAGPKTISDACISHVSKGAITTFRDVDVLGSGRDRIAYFRCIRSGLRDRSEVSAFAGMVPHVSPGFGGMSLGASFNL